MRIETNATDRRTLVNAIAEHLGQDAAYQGPPSFAYTVGAITVERDSSLSGEEADLEALKPFLREQGFLAQDITCISFPLTEFTPATLINLLGMLHARQYLIREMTRSNRLSIDEALITRLKEAQPDTVEAIEQIVQDNVSRDMVKGLMISEGTLSVEFPFDPDKPTEWNTYAKLLCTMADKAKLAHRVSAAYIHPNDDEMKYHARCWLMQLGFGGADFKALRGILLDHLHGYAAFRTADKMQQHQDKYAALRREHRATAQQPDLEAPAQDVPTTDKEDIAE